MKTPPTPRGRLLRWGKVLLLSAPLLTACAKDSNAQGTSASGFEPSATLVASNDNGGGKDTRKKADMKEVILHVFGMT